MVTKIKYVGTGESGPVTVNSSYLVLGMTFAGGAAKAVIIDDNGGIYATQASVNDPSEWVMDSVTVGATQQLFP